jgi:hypothetical protein
METNKLEKPKRIRSKNGDLFIVMNDGVNEGRRLALGLNARGDHRPIRLGYFFPIALYENAPDKTNIVLDRSQAVLVRKFGYLDIRDGKWPTVGRLKDFTRDAWPMPKFERTDSAGIRSISEYDEERLENYTFDEVLHRLPPDFDLSFVVRDGTSGCEALVVRLDDLLGPGTPAPDPA